MLMTKMAGRETVNNLINTINSMGPEIKKPLVLIMLSESIYDVLDKKVKDMIERYRFHVPKDFDLNDTGEGEG